MSYLDIYVKNGATCSNSGTTLTTQVSQRKSNVREGGGAQGSGGSRSSPSQSARHRVTHNKINMGEEDEMVNIYHKVILSISDSV